MEPLTLASAFASIVGLLGVFKSETRADESQDFNQFIAWLQTHRHEQLANLILDNAQLVQSLRTLTEARHDEVLAKLESLDEVLSGVASHLAAFKPLADAVRANTHISHQAISILRQLNATSASRFLEVRTSSGLRYHLMDDKTGMLQIDDERFIEDDLLSLCEYGLLRLDYGSRGSRIFIITRVGAAVGGQREKK